MSTLLHDDIDLTAGPFRLERRDGRYAVLGPSGEVIRRGSKSLDVAISMLNVVHAAGARTTRPCLCCRSDFSSSGPHNRLCETCKRRG